MKQSVNLILLFIGMLASTTFAQERPTVLAFCHEDENAFPWVYPVGEETQGLDIELFALLEHRLAVDIELRKLPWQRCLRDMQLGKVDGAFASSFKTERLEMGQYPTRLDGELDAEKRIHTSGYSLYRLKGSDLEWDGTEFKNLTGKIGAQSGFSVVEQLKEIGISVDDRTRGPLNNLQKMLKGRVQGVALQTLRADFVLANNPELAEKIEKYPVPISEKPYYLMLSFQLVERYPEFAEQIWDALVFVRESEEFNTIVNEFWEQIEEEE